MTSKRDRSKIDLVSPAEIAARLNVREQTVHAWRMRGILPEPMVVLSRVPIWRWRTIKVWSEETGHPRRSPHPGVNSVEGLTPSVEPSAEVTQAPQVPESLVTPVEQDLLRRLL